MICAHGGQRGKCGCKPANDYSRMMSIDSDGNCTKCGKPIGKPAAKCECPGHYVSSFSPRICHICGKPASEGK